MSAPAAPRRRVLLVLLLLTCTLNFADRAVFSALAQTIKADLLLTDLQLGLLQGLVFAALYALAGLPIGLLAERFSRKRIIASCTIIWSLATAATGMAGSFAELAASRLGVGMGEAGFVPPTASLVADIAPREKRASTFALVMLGTPIGTLLGAMLAGHIALLWHWRTAFLLFALPGFVVAGLLLLLAPEPERGRYDAGTKGGKAPPVGEFLREVAGNPTLLCVIAGGSLAGFGMTSISQFLAVFLARTHHLGVREAAANFGLISGLAITFGLIVGSFGTDWLARRDARQRAIGVQQMGADPGQRAKADDDRERRGPDDKLELSRMVPIRLVAGIAIGSTVAPGKQRRQDHHRNDDDEHEASGNHDQHALLASDIAGRIEDDHAAATEQGQGGERREPGKPPAELQRG